jgi:hypothetical protein
VLASVESDRRRNVWNRGSCDADGGDDLWCARYDSRPLLKAKDPSGRAESASRRSAWSAVQPLARRDSCILAATTDPCHCKAWEAQARHRYESTALSHHGDAFRDRLSHLSETAGRWRWKSWSRYCRCAGFEARHGGLAIFPHLDRIDDRLMRVYTMHLLA